MQSPDSQKITERFFTALYYLKTNRVIRGKNTFARRYGIGHGNLLQLERNKARNIFQTAWLTYLVNDYGISPRWLLTGEGSITSKKRGYGY